MKEISRRTLLKWSLGSAGSLALAPQLLTIAKAASQLNAGSSVSPTTGKERVALASTCTNCGAACGILGFLEAGELIKVEGNPNHPNNRGKICPRGLACVNEIYDPERILHPLKRAGERGEGNWKKISWDEALEMLAQSLSLLQKEGRPEEFFLQTDGNHLLSLTRRFARAYGTPHLITRERPFGQNKWLALQTLFGSPLEMPDIAHTRYILNFGANPFEAHFTTGLAQRIVEARLNRGAKLITFDPRLSNTAGKSDRWFPILPGTDGLIALAMANVIVKEGLADSNFLNSKTSFSLSRLKDHLSQFTLAMAEKESGIKGEEIKAVALEYASSKPATTLSGNGAVRHSNGFYNELAIALLNVITGNINVRGGYRLADQCLLPEPKPEPAELNVSGPSRISSIRDVMKEVEAGQKKVAVYLIHSLNPAFSSAAPQEVARFLKDKSLVPFLVVVDSHMTETAALADLVLPKAHHLEQLSIHCSPGFDGVSLVNLCQPLVKPRGEARPFSQVCLELAERLGPKIKKYFPFSNEEDYLKALISGHQELRAAGGLDHLKKEGFWENRSHRSTSSDKIGLASPALSLPQYRPIANHKKMKEDEFVLVSFKVNVQGHSRTQNNKWLSEIYHATPLIINPAAAARSGIKDGDLVRVSSDTGTVIARARLSQGIHPRVAGISFHGGHWEFGRVARAIPFRSDDPDTRLLWWQKMGNGVNANFLITPLTDPVGGGEASMDTVVKVERIDKDSL